jgi:hypothetical protein
MNVRAVGFILLSYVVLESSCTSDECKNPKRIEGFHKRSNSFREGVALQCSLDLPAKRRG